VFAGAPLGLLPRRMDEWMDGRRWEWAFLEDKEKKPRYVNGTGTYDFNDSTTTTNLQLYIFISIAKRAD